MPRARFSLPEALQVILLAIFLPWLLVLAVVALAAWSLYAASLYALLWTCWGLRGVNTLMVSSDSPVWGEHMREQVLPRLPANTVVLNWSERGRWPRFSLAVRAFRFFGGGAEYNPLVVVIRPLRRAKVFRFYHAFRDFKHGHAGPLADVERELDSIVACL